MDGKQHGKGIYTNTEGEVIECEWDHGKKVESPPVNKKTTKKNTKKHNAKGKK